MIVNKYVIIGAIAIAILLAFYGMFGLSAVTYQKSVSGQATAFLTVIPAEVVPTVNSSFLFATPTSTIDPALGDLRGITLGSYVQITGTGDAGLNIRAEAGKDSLTEFIGEESEVFKVIGGPVRMDDIVWWQLSTPYDESRQGWAAAEYLVLIQN
jgi:hypothetical protein